MAKNMFSIIVKCWREQQMGPTHLQVVRTDTAEEVVLNAGSFLVRIVVDEADQVERCLIRHINSGREVYIQSGTGLRAFIDACLLTGNNHADSV
ncbi:MAG TPA: hypothetical protein VKV40_00660 [Ktedonobacteraceae bacterium]|nr:hypothetical protein [Ktedonobacteraceae bacterium]